MKTKVTSRHVDLDESLRGYVEERLSRLNRYFDRVDEAHVVLSSEGHRKVADVTVHVAKAVIVSEQDADDLRSAFDRAMEKVERQIKKHKDRVRDRKHGLPMSEAAETVGGTAPETVGFVPETQAAESMTPAQALAELNAASVGFLLFLNSTTGRLNVLYRRADGQYGLVEPGE